MFINNEKVKKLLSGSFVLHTSSESEVLEFRRIIELAMKLGYWGGFVGQG